MTPEDEAHGRDRRPGPAPDSGRDRHVLEYYRRVAHLIDREPAEAAEPEFWRRESRRTGADRVLDLGCGTGRISALLVEEGSRLLGVDLSPEMLRRARRRLGDRPEITLVRADVRRLPVTGGWGLAVAAGGLFSHLLTDDDRDRALEEMARTLSPRGRLLLEGLWLPRPVFRTAARDEWCRRRDLRDGDPGEPQEVRERWTCDSESRLCRARFEYGPAGGGVQAAATFLARVWSEEEIRRRLRDAGFRIRHLWGDFRRREWSPERSSRLLVDAVRR